MWFDAPLDDASNNRALWLVPLQIEPAPLARFHFLLRLSRLRRARWKGAAD
jgi:hypothetical protein